MTKLIMQLNVLEWYKVEYPTSHLHFLVHPRVLRQCVYKENTSDKWDFTLYTTRERYTTILYHAMKNTVANTINATCRRAAHDGKFGCTCTCNTVEFPIYTLGCIICILLVVFSIAWYKSLLYTSNVINV